MSDVDELQRLIGERARVSARVGRYVGSLAGQALIDMDESRFPATFATAYVPMLNEPVNVWAVDGTWFLLGPTQGRPGQGVVTTVGSGLVTAATDFGEYVMPYVGAAPTSGDTIAIGWPGPTCLGVLSVQPVDPTVPPAPGGGSGVVQELTFRAMQAGSTDRHQARWWQAQPWASNSTYGAWFYGTQIKDTIPAGSTFVSLEFHVSRVQDQGSTPNFALHDQFWMGSVPSFASNVPWDPPNGWQPMPGAASWFGSLIGGGAWAGIGLNQGGFNKFASLAQDGESGALRIRWK